MSIWEGSLCQVIECCLHYVILVFSFAPLLLPVIVYLVTDDNEVKFHAKRSLISHIIPIVLLIVGFIIFSLSMFSVENRMLDMMGNGFNFWSLSPILFVLLYGLVTVIIFVLDIHPGREIIKIINMPAIFF